MKYTIAQTKLQMLSSKSYYLLLISLGLLISNVFLVWLLGWSFVHQKRTIVPAEISQSFTISDSTVDASYLRQMALFFVAERLNITPDNIDQCHNVILQHTDSRFYHKFVDILEKEKQAVIKQNISSVFYPEEIIANSRKLSVLVKGSLVHWVGNLFLAPMKKAYMIEFSYRSGNLKVSSFYELSSGVLKEKEEENSGVAKIAKIAKIAKK